MDTSDETPDIQSSLQDGYSRVDETAKRLAGEAAEYSKDAADVGESYVHQGMESLNKAGQAVASAIRERPFVSLLVAGLGGAMVALARRMR
jgi:hypothetical protein